MTKTDQSDLASLEDRAFCEGALPRVSRTFALSIQALPSSLRDAVGVAYLLCRVVDTIEDDAKIRSARASLFDAFDAALVGGDLAHFEALCAAQNLGPTEAERDLVMNAGAVFRVYRSLPKSQQVAIEPHVIEMSNGMREYSSRADTAWTEARASATTAEQLSALTADASGLRLVDLADLERYCYYVAGTVGGLLTSLFLEVVPEAKANEAWLRERATSFGLGLQLVNIVKDVAGDFERGDCFLPLALAEAHGLPLDKVLDPAYRTNGLALLRAVCHRARTHLDRAAEYIVAWPIGTGPQADVGHGAHVRLFCSVPLALAFATLREVEDGRDALVSGRAPSVSRALVQAVFSEAMTSVADDGALENLFDRCRFGAIGRCPRPKDPAQSNPFAPLETSQARPYDTALGMQASSSQASGTQASSTQASSSQATSTQASSSRATSTQATSTQATSTQASSSQASSTQKTAEKMQTGSESRQPDRSFTGRVFVTGAAGHLGANLLHRLLVEGRDVRVLLLPGANHDAIDAIERATGKQVERVLGDLRDLPTMQRALEGCETAFHVAAKVSTLGGSPADLRDLFECNVLGTANLLRAAREAGTKRVVVSGSLSAVGYDAADTQKPSNEAVPFYPFEEHLPYGRTKMQVEHECLKAVVEGLDVVIATSCAILGPSDYVPSRMGQTLIDFTHGRLPAYVPGGFEFVAARDIVEGHMLAMKRGRTGQKYIISTEFATVDQLMDIFEEVSGRPRPKLRLPGPLMAGVAQVTSFVLTNFFPKAFQRLTPGAVRILRQQRHADTTKAKVELGFEPTNIRAAIHEAYADFARRGLVPQSPTLHSSETGVGQKMESSRPKAKEKGVAA